VSFHSANGNSGHRIAVVIGLLPSSSTLQSYHAEENIEFPSS
jgi:hypothetical protein